MGAISSRWTALQIPCFNWYLKNTILITSIEKNKQKQKGEMTRDLESEQKQQRKIKVETHPLGTLGRNIRIDPGANWTRKLWMLFAYNRRRRRLPRWHTTDDAENSICAAISRSSKKQFTFIQQSIEQEFTPENLGQSKHICGIYHRRRGKYERQAMELRTESLRPSGKQAWSEGPKWSRTRERER